jgi:malonyl-CoA O-methyltransferase
MQGRMADELVALLRRSGLPGHAGRVLEVGCGSGILTGALLSEFSAGSYFANDLVAESSDFVWQVVRQHDVGEYLFLHGDIETIGDLPSDLDLVVSNATVQWFNDIGGFVDRMAACLRPGGLLAFSTFSTANMREITHLEKISLSYSTPEELADFAGGLFDIVTVREELKRIEFASPEEVLLHIRQTGVNGVDGRSWTRERYRHFLHRYRASFSSGNGVYLTYHPVYCCFRRKAR